MKLDKEYWPVPDLVPPRRRASEAGRLRRLRLGQEEEEEDDDEFDMDL